MNNNFLSLMSLVLLPIVTTSAQESQQTNKAPKTKGTPAMRVNPIDTTNTPRAVPAIRATPWVSRKLAPGAAAATAPTGLATLEPGVQAPDFVSQDLAGKPVRLSDLKNAIVVLDFWATWCGPCMVSLPHTQEVANRYKEQGVVVLATCTGDSRVNFEEFVKANQEKYPDLLFTCDPNEKASETFDERASRRLYGVSGIPTQFVIGRDGKVVAVLSGYSNDDARLEAGLARAGIKVDPVVAAKGEAQFRKGGS